MLDNISLLYLWVHPVIQGTLAPKGDDVGQVPLLHVKLPAHEQAHFLILLRGHTHVALVQLDGWQSRVEACHLINPGRVIVGQPDILLRM